MTILTLPRDIANQVRAGYVSAKTVVEFLLTQGFSKPAGKPLNEINLSMLKRGGYKIQSAKFDIVAGTIHLEMA